MKVINHLFSAIVLVILLSASTKAQTNTFPSSGSVGIGTTSPIYPLHAVAPYAKTSTGTQQFAAFFSTNEASASSPFGLRIGLIGASSTSGRYAALQTTEYNLVDGGNISMQAVAGSVGIGTTTPLSLLHASKANGTAYSSAPQLRVSSAYTNGNPAAIVFSDDALSDAKISYLPASATTDRLLSLSASSVESDFVIRGDGHIGIGTTSPLGLLHVAKANGSAYSSTAQLRVSAAGTGGDRAAILLSDDGLSDAKISYLPASATTDRLLSLSASSVESDFVIRGDGNIGVGTTSPSEKFSVKGNIRAQKMIVTQTGWSDYVFDKKYSLRSLSSLETYIDQNRHLPDVPSAKEVEEKGISVGDNQALLLKKIEELTLYVIQLKKESIEQQKRISALEKTK